MKGIERNFETSHRDVSTFLMLDFTRQLFEDVTVKNLSENKHFVNLNLVQVLY
jgi:hypothetical protein